MQFGEVPALAEVQGEGRQATGRVSSLLASFQMTVVAALRSTGKPKAPGREASCSWFYLRDRGKAAEIRKRAQENDNTYHSLENVTIISC